MSIVMLILAISWAGGRPVLAEAKILLAEITNTPDHPVPVAEVNPGEPFQFGVCLVGAGLPNLCSDGVNSSQPEIILPSHTLTGVPVRKIVLEYASWNFSGFSGITSPTFRLRTSVNGTVVDHTFLANNISQQTTIYADPSSSVSLNADFNASCRVMLSGRLLTR